MLDHLRAAFIAVMLAFSLLTGSGAVAASASPAGLVCQDQASSGMSADHSLPNRECGQSMMGSTCAVHVTCGAILVSLSAGADVHGLAAGWRATPPSSLTWTRLPPDTPPPIALL
jgi:hypothetical protein